MSRSFGGSLCSLVIGPTVDDWQTSRLAGRRQKPSAGGEQKLVRATREPLKRVTPTLLRWLHRKEHMSQRESGVSMPCHLCLSGEVQRILACSSSGLGSRFCKLDL